MCYHHKPPPYHSQGGSYVLGNDYLPSPTVGYGCMKQMVSFVIGGNIWCVGPSFIVVSKAKYCLH